MDPGGSSGPSSWRASSPNRRRHDFEAPATYDGHESPAKRRNGPKTSDRACPPDTRGCVPSVCPRPRMASSSPVRRVARNPPPNLNARRVRLKPRLAYARKPLLGTLPAGEDEAPLE